MAGPSKRKLQSDAPPKKGLKAPKKDQKAPADVAPKVKTTSMRTKTEVFEAAGEPSRTKSFILCDQTEAKLAAYLAYKDIADLRAFCVSHYHLQFWLQLGLWSRNLRSHVALELIRDASERFPIDETPAEKYPLEELEKYPAEMNDIRNHRLAHLLMHMATKITTLSMTLTPSPPEQSRLGAVFESTRPNCRLPSLANITIHKPILSTQYSESCLEQYNRVYNLLKYFSHCTSTTMWPRRFSPNWHASILVNPSNIPFWMRPTSLSSTTLNPAAQEPALKAQVIKIVWKRRAVKDLDVKELEEHIKNEDLIVPNTTQIAEGDARILNLPQFRDTIRRQYNCGSLGFQLKTVVMELVPADENEEVEVYNLFDCNWALIQEKLKSISSEDTAVRIDIRLRLLDTSNNEPLLESKDPPPALKTLFAMIDNGDLPQLTNSGEIEEHDKFVKTVSSQKPGVYVLNPKKRFSDQASFLKHFDGYNVEEPGQLKIWQEKVLQSIPGTVPHAQEPVRKSRIAGQTLDQEQQGILLAAQEQGEFAAMVKGDDDLDADDIRDKPVRDMEYYAIQGAFTGSQGQTGPMLDPCIKALKMTLTEKANPTDPDLYSCDLIKANGKARSFFSYQITGACFMLLRTLGYIPLPKSHSESIQDVLQDLQSIQTYGGIIADQTGLGKTVQTLLFLHFFTQYHTEPDTNGNAVHKPILLAVPANLVLQWAEEIRTHWPDFNLIISYDMSSLPSVYEGQIVSSSAIKQLPKTTILPPKFHYLLQVNNPTNKRTIWLTSTDTHGGRYVKTKTTVVPAKPYDPPQYDSEGKERFVAPQKIQQEYVTRMEGQFQMTVVDEGHTCKTPQTRNWAGIWLAKAKYNWLITATPMINRATDIIGLLMLLWRTPQEQIQNNPAILEFVQSFEGQPYEILDQVAALNETDMRRLVALDPRRIRSLLVTKDETLIAKLFHVCDDLVSLRRSAASMIMRNKAGDAIELRQMIRKHSIRTISLERKPREAATYQWFHQDAARRYVEEIKGQGFGNGDRSSTFSTSTVRKEQDKIVYPTVPLRDLDIANASTWLARFNLYMRKADRSTLVEEMDGWRTRGFDGEDFINWIHRPGDPIVQTRGDYIRFLCDGSPTLRAIFAEIYRHVLSGEKILVTENVPLVAWHWEIAIQLLMVGVSVLHSGLNQTSRQDIASDFNSAGSRLRVLIIMYNVGGQGINLHHACHRVFVATGAVNLAKQLQAIGRVIRVTQRKEVVVTCVHIHNSHSAFKEYKQSDKAIIELATRAHEPRIRELLILLLQEHQKEVVVAHKSRGAVELQDRLAKEPTPGEEPVEGLAGTFDDLTAETVAELQHVTTELSSGRPKRVVKPVQRYSPCDYDDASGDYIANPTRAKISYVVDDVDEEDKSGLDADHNYGDSAANTDAETSSNKSGTEKDSEKEDLDYKDPVGSGASGSESEPEPTLQAKIHRAKMAAQDCADELYTEEEQQLRTLLSIDPDHIYTDDDLNDPEILRRGIRLLYKARLGQAAYVEGASIHIKYDQLHGDLMEEIKKQNHAGKKQIQSMARRLGNAPARAPTESTTTRTRKTVLKPASLPKAPKPALPKKKEESKTRKPAVPKKKKEPKSVGREVPPSSKRRRHLSPSGVDDKEGDVDIGEGRWLRESTEEDDDLGFNFRGTD